jgi:hypothetical protein
VIIFMNVCVYSIDFPVVTDGQFTSLRLGFYCFEFIFNMLQTSVENFSQF